MESFDPVLFRRRTLTNSAAEFVEGNGLKIINEVLVPADIEEFHDNAEYIPEIDRFVSKGIVFEYICHGFKFCSSRL
jgi:hypothetical protein